MQMLGIAAARNALMNPRLGIFAAFAALALADCSEVKADQTLAIFASNAIHVADAGSDLAQARKDLNDTIDKSNGGFRKDTEEAAAKYEEAKTTVAKWLHDYPKATQDQKKHADNALDSLKHH